MPGSPHRHCGNGRQVWVLVLTALALGALGCSDSSAVSGSGDGGANCATPCGGDCCGGGTVCNQTTKRCEPRCVASCANRQCGSDGCSGTCGSCTSPKICGPAGTCQTCVAETDAAICTRLGKNCGTLTALDNCGQSRTASCGGCSSPNTCGGGGVNNVCGTGGTCVSETDKAFCARVGKNCGAVADFDNCGQSRPVPTCGNCTSPKSCGVYTANVCDNDCRLSASVCTGMTWCDSASGQCKQGCGTGTQCGSNETCDPASHACVCQTGFHQCSGACVSDTSTATCGTSCSPCPVPANGSETCNGTSCGVSCGMGFHLCGTSCLSNTSAGSCGTSCSPCPVPTNGTATCNGTSCALACNSGFHLCSGQCVSNSSPATCGSSCTACLGAANATATCDGTSCGVQCNSGYLSCGGACAACPSQTNGAAYCAGSSCAVRCNPGFFRCASGCCGATAVRIGGWHVCALTSEGGVKCWGYNGYGQLGNGTRTDSHQPGAVTGLASGVSSIAVGNHHTCAALSAGGVKCWGLNDHGQLGDGTSWNASTPQNVRTLTSGGLALSAGYSHTCALTGAGGVTCWGYNAKGQVGDGSTTDRSTPVDVTGLTAGVRRVAAGYFDTCAVTNVPGGVVNCWGDNSWGQLGDGTTTNSSTPVAVTALTALMTAVGTAGSFACAITNTGALKCWGDNSSGQLGDGTTTNRPAPVDVVVGLSTGAKVVGTGGLHSCAVTGLWGLKCWGDNRAGEVGDGTTTDRATPVDVVGLTSGVKAVTLNGENTCALLDTGGVKCWGANGSGQLGDGTTTRSLTPVDVVDP